MGKPKEFSEEDKELVLKMALAGCTHDQISKVLKCDRGTLVKYFGDELETCKYRRHGMIAGKLYELAEKGDRTALIFLAKTQLRWRETSNLEISGQGGGALTPLINVTINKIDGRTEVEKIEGATDVEYLPAPETGSGSTDKSD